MKKQLVKELEVNAVKATPHISRKMIKQKKNTRQIDRVYKKYPILCSQGKPNQTDRDVLSAR